MVMASSLKEADPLIQRILKNDWIENEVVLVQTDCKIHSLDETEEENEGDAIWFSTNFRIGFYSNTDISLFRLIPYRCVRAINFLDEAKFQFRANLDQWFELDQDEGYTVIFPNDTIADQVGIHLLRIRYDQPPEAIMARLPQLFQATMNEKYDFVLSELDRLRSSDLLSGIIELWRAKTLRLQGAKVEAVSFLARVLWKSLLADPSIILSEYIWYPWHDGTLRLLPAATGFSEDGWEIQRLTLLAIEAKAQGNIEKFIQYSCDALKLDMKRSEHFNPRWIDFLANSVGYLYPVTKPYLQEVAAQMLKHYFRSPVKEADASIELFLEDLFDDLIADVNFLQRKLGVTNRFSRIKLKSDILLQKERFSELLRQSYSKSNMSPPDRWDVDEFRSLNLKECDTAYLRMIGHVYQTIAHVRHDGIHSDAAVEGLREMMDADYLAKLERYEEDTLGFLVMLLIVEKHLIEGHADQALLMLQNGKRKYGYAFGLLRDPFLKYGAVICSAYEAWALGDIHEISASLRELPQGAPYEWIHKLLMASIDTLKAAAVAYGDQAEVIAGMQEASVLASVLSDSDLLDQDIRKKLSEYTQLLTEQLSVVRSMQSNNDDSARGVEIQQPKSKLWSMFDKMISRFFRSKTADQPQPQLNRLQQSAKFIRIAIAGESSSGKTTLLNAVFNTNIFFVTQEEATGVPTEIRYAEQMSIEVWDRDMQLRQSLQSDPAWLEEDGSTLMADQLRLVSDFIMQHTKVGSPALEWVERVVVYMPLAKLPKHVVLIDTPGFNADPLRTAITEKEMKACHMCMYIMDARNALKRGEKRQLEFIKEEAGKTFILLNKIDQVLGDDDLDCDGADAIEETLVRVRQDLASYFNLPEVIVYPICSVPKTSIPAEMHRYADHLQDVTSLVFHEAENQKLDLIIDASAKKVIDLHRNVKEALHQHSEAYEQELRYLEIGVPKDFSLFEEQVELLILNSVNKYRTKFMNTMMEQLDAVLNNTVDSMVRWLQEIDSASVLRKEIESQTTELINQALAQIDRTRKFELDWMAKRVSGDGRVFILEIYENLPFTTTLDVSSSLNSLFDLKLTTSSDLQAELASINYGDGLNGGSVAGAIVGTLLLGPIGALVGGFIGQLLGGKSLTDVKKEVYDKFSDALINTWDQIAEIVDNDLSEERTASFINHLHRAMNKQIQQCKQVVTDEIHKRESALRVQYVQHIQLQHKSRQIQDIMDRTRQWRISRKSSVG